jgi:hypothetical protein
MVRWRSRLSMQHYLGGTGLRSERRLDPGQPGYG